MAPVDISPVNITSKKFELICSIKANNLVPVHKYKSLNTGLTVVIAEVEGPVVNGYFCLATEAHDDDGLPHTLEHLIFLGSEKYPYKGVLDLLANRCLASGTNAWTDTDHTCYTMTTAGSQGFLSLMPIYLDHILYPTLTDSAFATEVHHVTGDGDDGGVVYCEMQGRENTGESLTNLALLRAIYPGHCGYKSETGGVLKNLRESTTNEKVRAYHKQFYRPENLTLIITGQVAAEEVFKALEVVEESIVAHGERGSFTRPWQDPVPPLTHTQNLEVLYPCDDEDNGMVYVAWRGPSAVTELYEMSACGILLKYLTDTSVSPLRRHFVEIDDPYASQVSYNISENSECALYLQFEGVPVSKLSSLGAALEDFLRGLDTIDTARLQTVICRHTLETLSHLENSPHEALAFALIGDALYGQNKDDLNERLNSVSTFRRLGQEPPQFWLDLLARYLVSTPHVTACGRPSRERQEQMAQEEEERVRLQTESLGAEGLAARAEQLAAAMKQNEVPPSEEMLTSVAIPSVDSIRFHPVSRYTTSSENQHERLDLSLLPVYAHLDDVHTNFVYMFVLMDTSSLSRDQRRYLPLLLESLLEMPIKRDGVVVPHETVVAELEADTVATSARQGVESAGRFSAGPFSHHASLMMQLEPGKLDRCISWVRELLHESIFTTDRLKIIATKIINEVSQAKRKGNKVVGELMKSLRFSKDSNHHHCSMLRQHHFLTSLLPLLDSEAGSTEVLQGLEAVRAAITEPSNVTLHLAAAAGADSALGEAGEVWGRLLPDGLEPKRNKLSPTPDWKLLNPSTDSTDKKESKGDEGPQSGSCIVGLGCVESSFLSRTTECITDFNDPDLPPLLVFLQYLTQLEGPMWRQIRGAGLAYGYSIVPRPNEGLLHLSLYRATNCVAAYKEARDIVQAQLGPSPVDWNGPLLEAARSSLVFEVIEREKSVGDVVAQSLLAYFKAVEHDYNRRLVERIAAVTEEDLNRVGVKYVAPLFDSDRALTCVVCHPTKVVEIASGFKQMGCQLTVHTTLEESPLGQ